MTDRLIADIKSEEGFSGVCYTDTEGFETIGYGTKTPITKEEAELLLRNRLKDTVNKVNVSYSHLDITDEAWDILYNMAYQLGVNGLGKFKKMLDALYNNDYIEASKEGRDSLWYRQTPNRAERLMDRMERII